MHCYYLTLRKVKVCIPKMAQERKKGILIGPINTRLKQFPTEFYP